MAPKPITTKTTIEGPADESGKATKVVKESTIQYELGDNLAHASQLFGETVVAEMYEAGATIKVQNKVRGMLADGASQEEIEKELAGWKLGDTVARKPRDPKQDYMKVFLAMSPEEQAAEIQRLKAARQS